MADGSITFSTSLDNSDLEKQLAKAEKDVDRLKAKVESDTDKRTLIEKAMDRNEQAIERTKQELDSLRKQLEDTKAVSPTDTAAYVDAQQQAKELEAVISQTEKDLQKQIVKQDQLNESWQKANDLVEVSQEKLDRANARYAELGATAQQSAARASTSFDNAANVLKSRVQAAANVAEGSLRNAANRAYKPFEVLSNKIYKTMRKVFVFSFIVAGIRAIKSQLASMIGENERFHASIENLKVVASGFIAQLGNIVLPVFVSVVNALAGILERLAGFIDFIFGSNIAGFIQQARSNASAQIQQGNADKSAEYSKNVAKAQEKQAKSAKKLAKAQKEANAQLLSFDELNVLSAESSEDAADAMDMLSESDDLTPPELETDWTQDFIPDAGLLNGFLLWLDELRSRIATDVEGPFARIREGLALIKKGLSEVVEGLKTGDFALVWAGIVDTIVGSLYVVEGVIDGFLDWLDSATGGRFSGIIEGAKQIVHGFVEFIEGVLRGDVKLAFQGLYDILDGAETVVKNVISGVIDFIRSLVSRFFGLARTKWNEFFDALEKRFPQFKSQIETARQIVNGAIDFISGVIDKGLSLIKGALNSGLEFIVGIVRGALMTIQGFFTGDTDLIERGIKTMLNSVISLLESALNGFLDGSLWLVNQAIDLHNWLTGDSVGRASFNWIQIPRLASGAVIPPNREFMAVLGDQTNGNNIETPENLMRQIVREESGGGNNQIYEALMQILQAVQDGHTLTCDGAQIARVVNQRNASGFKIHGW